MATNPAPMTDAEVKASRRQVSHLMRHPRQHHPSARRDADGVPITQDHPVYPEPALIHYALDLESPPLIACEAPDANKWTAEPGKVTCPDCMSHEEFPLSAVRPKITGMNVLMEAAMLLSEDGENPEYDRAILELTSALMGAGQDDAILMTRILRALKQGE